MTCMVNGSCLILRFHYNRVRHSVAQQPSVICPCGKRVQPCPLRRDFPCLAPCQSNMQTVNYVISCKSSKRCHATLRCSPPRDVFVSCRIKQPCDTDRTVDAAVTSTACPQRQFTCVNLPRFSRETALVGFEF